MFNIGSERNRAHSHGHRELGEQQLPSAQRAARRTGAESAPAKRACACAASFGPPYLQPPAPLASDRGAHSAVRETSYIERLTSLQCSIRCPTSGEKRTCVPFLSLPRFARAPDERASAETASVPLRHQFTCRDVLELAEILTHERDGSATTVSPVTRLMLHPVVQLASDDPVRDLDLRGSGQGTRRADVDEAVRLFYSKNHAWRTALLRSAHLSDALLADIVRALRGSSALEVLDLGYTACGRETLRAVVELARAEHRRARLLVDLTGCNLHGRCTPVAHLVRCIDTLVLHACTLSGADLAALASALPDATALRCLALSRVSLVSAERALARGIAAVRPLAALEVAAADVTSDFVRELAAAMTTGSGSLRELSMWGNRLARTAIPDLTALSETARLECLDLGANTDLFTGVPTPEIVAFVRTVGQHAHSLGLAFTGVSSAALPSLEAARAVRCLDLRQTPPASALRASAVTCSCAGANLIVYRDADAFADPFQYTTAVTAPRASPPKERSGVALRARRHSGASVDLDADERAAAARALLQSAGYVDANEVARAAHWERLHAIARHVVTAAVNEEGARDTGAALRHIAVVWLQGLAVALTLRAMFNHASTVPAVLIEVLVLAVHSATLAYLWRTGTRGARASDRDSRRGLSAGAARGDDEDGATMRTRIHATVLFASLFAVFLHVASLGVQCALGPSSCIVAGISLDGAALALCGALAVLLVVPHIA